MFANTSYVNLSFPMDFHIIWIVYQILMWLLICILTFPIKANNNLKGALLDSVHKMIWTEYGMNEELKI